MTHAAHTTRTTYTPNGDRARTDGPDGRADTVCVAFFCVRLRGTAGGGRLPVWRGRRVRAALGTPTDRGRIRNTKKRTRHTVVDDDGNAKPPETAAGAGAGATAAAACLRFAARDVLGCAFATHRERSVAAYGNNDDGADEGETRTRSRLLFLHAAKKAVAVAASSTGFRFLYL